MKKKKKKKKERKRFFEEEEEEEDGVKHMIVTPVPFFWPVFLSLLCKSLRVIVSLIFWFDFFFTVGLVGCCLTPTCLTASLSLSLSLSPHYFDLFFFVFREKSFPSLFIFFFFFLFDYNSQFSLSQRPVKDEVKNVPCVFHE